MHIELAPMGLRAPVVGLGFVLLFSSIAPASAMTTPPDENTESTIRFECPVGINLLATFSGGDSPTVQVEIERSVWTLPRVPSATGTKYSNGKVTFWTKGESARFESPDLTMNCVKSSESDTGLKALTSSEWRLVSLSENGTTSTVPEGMKVDATFEDGRVSGGGICNRYFASYKASHDQAISIGEVGATLMMCPDHAEFEREYFRMLNASIRFDVRNGVLELSTPDGSLRFAEVR